jgi:hypothetical protein
MKRKQVLLVALVVLLAVSLTTTLTLAQAPVGTGQSLAPLAAMGTAFTYQGQLKDSGGAVNGTCDLQFGLWDALTLGAQIGVTQTKTTVTIANGLFTTQIDFGADRFNGEARWLATTVRCPEATGSYIPLTPRQPLTPAPYALYASNANLLDGQDSSAFVTLSGAQTVSGLKTFSAGVRFADATTQTSAAKTPENVIVVAKSGGDFTTITAARNSIADASATNRYLIYVAPGTYTEAVTMKPYVDIEGAGELATKITRAGSAATNTGTVVGANNAELRFLTVENTGGGANAIAIYNNGVQPRLTHITASASGGTTTNYGIFNTSASLTMVDVTASASGGATNYGVYNISSSPTMNGVTATGAGGTSQNYGVVNLASSSPRMTDVTATASGGTNNYGVYSSSSASLAMTDVTVKAMGGTNNYGLYNSYSWVTVNNSFISANGGTGSNIGIKNLATSDAYVLKVNNSQISGDTSTISNDTCFTAQVGASQLDGGAALSNGGMLKCVGVYDESYAVLSGACL